MKIFSKVINDETKLLDCIACGDEPLEGYSDLPREIGYDGNWYLKGYAPEKSKDIKEKEVREVRNSYLEKYVDPYQLVIRWETLSNKEQEELKGYRQYLLDYTDTEDWWEQNPKTLDEWKDELDG